MRAAVLARYREPLEFQDNLPMPAAGPDDVVIRVEACGIWPEVRRNDDTLNFYTSSTYM